MDIRRKKGRKKRNEYKHTTTQMDIKTIMVNEKSHMGSECLLYDSIYMTLQKMQATLKLQKANLQFLWKERKKGQEEKTTKGQQGNVWGGRQVHYLD